MRTRLLLAGALVLLAVPAFAQESGTERAITRTADDSQLKWGPCPSFMPAGCSLTVLHGDPTKANADVLLKLPANSKIPEHWHTSAERMILLSGELEVTYKGQPKSVMKAATYAYGPAKLSHDAACVSSTPCMLFIAFEAPVDAVATQ